MNCQRCDSYRIVTVTGKTSDMCTVAYDGCEANGYVPTGLFFGQNGYGNYMEITFCAECGQIQETFPITANSLMNAIEEMEG